MEAVERRKKIIEIVSKADGPITGSELSELLDVTRQVVVQDVALLRASGTPIFATSSGYLMLDMNAKKLPLKVFTCRHLTLEQAEAELMIIVENGGRVRDVIIEHPVYGEITGTLMLNTIESVKNLIERLRRKDSLMLSSIVDGVHMHTIEATSEAELLLIEKKLREAGILL